MDKSKITVEQVINNILNEQESLRKKKDQIHDLIDKLSISLKQLDQKSYRGSHLTGEAIKSLVTTHDLDIKISNTLLRSYEQLARLLKEQESSEEVSYDLLSELMKSMNNPKSLVPEGGNNE